MLEKVYCPSGGWQIPVLLLLFYMWNCKVSLSTTSRQAALRDTNRDPKSETSCLCGMTHLIWLLFVQISHNLLEPIITVFVANGERYNLLNSVVLEMFDFIRRENIKSLTAYFMDKLYSHVEDVDYDATFLKLKDKYEQSQDYVSTQSAAASSQLQASRIRRDERALDRGPPLYFDRGPL